MQPEQHANPPADFTDRSDRLMAMGIIQIILGGLCGLLVLFTLAAGASRAPYGRTGTAGNTLLSVLIMVLLAVFFIWSGIGSVKRKRWVRPLMLSVMWPALLVGTSVTFLLVAVLPAAFGKMGVSGEVVSFTTTFVLIVVLVFYVVVPLAHILAYSNPEVQRTTDQHDPVTRWTDGRPIPVVALAIWLGTSAVFVALTGLSTRVAPFFGTLLTGWPAVLFWLVMAGVMSALVRPVYRMQPAGWWGTVALTSVGLVSSGITFASIDLVDLLHANPGIPASEARLIEPAFSVMVGPMVGLGVFWAVAFLVFVVWIRRHFLEAPASFDR